MQSCGWCTYINRVIGYTTCIVWINLCLENEMNQPLLVRKVSYQLWIYKYLTGYFDCFMKQINLKLRRKRAKKFQFLLWLYNIIKHTLMEVKLKCGSVRRRVVSGKSTLKVEWHKLIIFQNNNNCVNRIYNKILDHDWFSARLFVT